MFEASKTRALRDIAFYEKYFSGSVLDIGCGRDLVVPHAQPFDLMHGDANRITNFLPDGSAYDCVHSSHCLEHMRDVPGALAQWWSLVLPGGYLIVVVPHEDLYEQGIWPSIFNGDHKATFRFGTRKTWSPVSYDLKELLGELPAAEIVDIALQDHQYDYSLKRHGITRFGRAVVFFSRAHKAAMRHLKADLRKLDRVMDKMEYRLGKPIDQTLGEAVAQIQAVVRKRDLTQG